MMRTTYDEDNILSTIERRGEKENYRTRFQGLVSWLVSLVARLAW